MKTSQPPLSLRPQRPRTDPDEALRRLEKVSDWTEEPSREAAAAVVGQGAEPIARTDAPAPAQPPAPVRPKMPWDEEGGGMVSFHIRLPAQLAAKLRYVGGSTYGETITSIVEGAVSQRVEQMLKERNLQ